MGERMPANGQKVKSNESKVKTNITLLPGLRDKLEFAAYRERKDLGEYRSVSDILSDSAEKYLKEKHPDIEELMKNAGLL